MAASQASVTMFRTLNTLLDPIQSREDDGAAKYVGALVPVSSSVGTPAKPSVLPLAPKPGSALRVSKPKQARPMHSIIMGLRYRSKTGCVQCRKRKKKCDEVHPSCGSCMHRGEVCEWGEVKRYRPPAPQISHVTDTPLDNTVHSQVVALLRELPRLPDNTQCGFGLTSSDLLLVFSPSDFLDFDTPILSSPLSTFSLYLDEAGLRLMDFYENRVARLLCVSPESSNYFLKTFFTAALTEPALMHALAAWGGVFLDGKDSNGVKHHVGRAGELIRTTYLNQNKLDSHGTYVAMCYYLIHMGIDICSGDVSHWYKLFNECTNLLNQRGGIVQFCRENHFSNDSKWLISNFQFHDVLSSATIKRGTSCDIEDYRSLFNNCFDMGSYGVDPYQGCIQPIFLLLGSIMNSSVELNEERDRLSEERDRITKELSAHGERDAGSASQDAHRQLTLRRIAYCNAVEARYNKHVSEIHYCTPNASQISHISHDRSEVDLHLTLFELYRLTCHIYLLLYIKQTQPLACEVQLHFMSSLAYIESLMDSKLVPLLPMLLLICGMCCCNEYDRSQVRTLFERVLATYTVGNMGRVWEIVQEAWRRNPNGDVCVDWGDICDEFGWQLSVC